MFHAIIEESYESVRSKYARFYWGSGVPMLPSTWNEDWPFEDGVFVDPYIKIFTN